VTPSRTCGAEKKGGVFFSFLKKTIAFTGKNDYNELPLQIKKERDGYSRSFLDVQDKRPLPLINRSLACLLKVRQVLTRFFRF